MDKWYISTNNEDPKPLKTVDDFKKNEEYLDEQFITYETKYADDKTESWPNTGLITYHRCIICGEQFKRKSTDALKIVFHSDLFEKVCDHCFNDRIELFYKCGRGSGKTQMVEEFLKEMAKKDGNRQ